MIAVDAVEHAPRDRRLGRCSGMHFDVELTHRSCLTRTTGIHSSRTRPCRCSRRRRMVGPSSQPLPCNESPLGRSWAQPSRPGSRDLRGASRATASPDCSDVADNAPLILQPGCRERLADRSGLRCRDDLRSSKNPHGEDCDHSDTRACPSIHHNPQQSRIGRATIVSKHRRTDLVRARVVQYQ